MAGDQAGSTQEQRSNAPMYGGQAVIEGVMMRGPQHFAVAARRANGGIALTCEPVPKVFRPAWQKWPLLRGMFALVDSMTLGTKALFWAAKVAEADMPTGVGADEKAPPSPATGPASVDPQDPALAGKSSRVGDVAIGGAMVTGLVMAVGLFKVLPQLLIEVFKQAGVTHTVTLGLIDFAMRFTIFLVYILSISRMKHVFRVFQYHGAEHKAINALEAHGVQALYGEDAVAKARAASRLHPRCGTSFIVIVIFLSVLAVIPFYDRPLYWRIPIQLAMLFPVAGISFELLRLAGRFRNNPIAAALSRPGMWAQYLTTREPDDSQLEVALASLKAVMSAEREESKSAEPVAERPAAAVA